MNTSSLQIFAPSRRVPSVLACSRQRGVSLFVAIVALVLMTIAGLSMMRLVDTGNVIAGNLAFREGAVNAADTGIEAAATYLNTVISPSPDVNLPVGCTVGTSASALGTCRYSARIMPEDDKGLPFVDWSNTANIPVTSLNGNDVQFVVERLCNPSTSLTVTLGAIPYLEDSKGPCSITPRDGMRSNMGGKPPPPMPVEIIYRITIRVQGPRNTITMVQAIQGR